MNTEFIEIRLVNTGDSGVGLRDTQNRIYNVPINGQLRIGLENFKSILDNPVSKNMVCKGLVSVDGIKEEMLRGSILTDEERDYILGDRIAPAKEDSGVQTVEVEEEKGETPIVKAITFYNWIKNEKEDKIREALNNPVNYDTVRDIIAKNDKYKTELVEKLLKECE